MLRRMACLAIVLLSTAGCLAPPDGLGSEQGQGTDRVSRLLTNDIDSRIAIHAYYVEGREPVPAAMTWLAGRLEGLTGKVEVTVGPAVRLVTGTDARDTNWTSQRTRDLFDTLDVPSQAGTFPLVFLFLDGYGYTYGGKAAGFQAERYIAIFPDTFRGAGLSDPVDLAVPIPDPDGNEDRKVLLHESGHMLGLVDNGAPMVRDHVDRSEDCACHSSNPESVMASSVDTLTVVKSVVQPQDFDADDLADLKAFRDAAKARR